MSTLLIIPLPCTLEHLLGDETLPLGRPGRLSLVSPPEEEQSLASSVSNAASGATTAPDAAVEAEATIVVILKVGDLAFPLSRKTPFGTTNDPFSYLFKPFLPGLPPGWVRLSLPCSTSQAFPDQASQNLNNDDDGKPELISLRDAFETVLVRLGLLTDSIVIGTADDVGQSTRASLGAWAQSIDRSAHQRIEETPSGREKEGGELQVGGGTKRFVEGIDGLAKGVRDVSGSVTGALQNGVQWVGNEVGKRLPEGKKQEVKEHVEDKREGEEGMTHWETTKEAVGAVVGGVADGSTTLASHSSQAAQDVVTHSKGPEAGELIGHVSNTAVNLGGTASDVVVGTSTILLGGMGLKAAAEADRGAHAEGKEVPALVEGVDETKEDDEAVRKE